MDESLIQVKAEGDVLIVTAAAEQLTALRAVDQFADDVKQLLETRSERRWVLDFGGATFIVTPAISALVVVLKKLRSEGGELVLTGLSANVRHIFELMRLDQVLTVTEDVAAGLDVVRDGA